MTSRADRIPGFSDADMAAFDLLVACHLQTQQAAVELAREIIQLAKPSPDKPKRLRYMRVERPERGVVVADVLNERTGRVRRFRFTREPDGDGIDVEEE